MKGATRQTRVMRTPPASGRGATSRHASWGERFRAWRHHHVSVALESLARLRATPVATMMTMMVMAIALSLPAGLYMLLHNAQLISGDWGGRTQISVYLRSAVSDPQAAQLREQLEAQGDIQSVRYQNREASLQEFMEFSGYPDWLAELDENPLPAVLIIEPAHLDPERVSALRNRLAALPEADQVQLDDQWVKRLYALLELGVRAVWVLALTLSVAILLVMTNTIRLAIENRRDEIVIVRMVGGTDTFIRRPFLYTGLWYGFGGGFLALILSESMRVWLDAPVRELAQLYGSSFRLEGLGFGPALVILGGSALLGLAGSLVAVNRHLQVIEPG
jgi:cell division transport system permease protein